MMNVLVVGGGGREHSLALHLMMSADVGRVYVAPGNAGTGQHEKMRNVTLDLKDFPSVCAWCKTNAIGLVVVGPEDPLAAGIADALNAAQIPCFGPSQAAAQIEASKDFSKEFMSRYNIPTARYASFTEVGAAHAYIDSAPFEAHVIKASGLAAGKGVIVASSDSEAKATVNTILQDSKFGSAGNIVIIEERLEGFEVSVFGITDGTVVIPMLPAQDNKRLGNGDTGPNTGGMGAYAPCKLITAAQYSTIVEDVLKRAVAGLAQDGKPFVGCLYAGIMVTKEGIKCLEFNCRFGDPETQVVLPLLKSDLLNLLYSAATGTLDQVQVEWREGVSLIVVAVSEGYPGSYTKGQLITGLKEAEANPGVKIIHAGTVENEGKVLTTGGRVLGVTVLADTAVSAFTKVYSAIKHVQYKGIQYRTDIGSVSLGGGVTYAESGVDVGAGDRFIDLIKPLSKATLRPGCDAELGGFGALFDLKAAGYNDALLVTGTDGVGTKLKLAQDTSDYSTLGIDLVAMCANDVLTTGAEPLIFLDYFAVGKLDVEVGREIVRGVAAGCVEAGCALVGGETAEMPGVYSEKDFDLAGFCVGAVSRDSVLPLKAQVGDVLIGLPSSGVHSNGFSLVRRVLANLGVSLQDPAPWDSATTIGSALLTPTRLYTKAMMPLIKAKLLRGAAHITGGGLTSNIERVLGANKCDLDASSWPMMEVFKWLSTAGAVTPSEMSKTFNIGIGMVLVVPPENVKEVQCALGDVKEKNYVIGSVSGGAASHISNLELSLISESYTPLKIIKKNVAVLISGSGTNLQCLIDACQSDFYHPAKISLVVSNRANAYGLTRAKIAGIPTCCINHKEFKSREDFDMEVHRHLVEHNIELVCLAGFMRILSGKFTRLWQGKLINIHPSLLPSFKGFRSHEQVLAAGVTLTGCTVHYVEEEVDNGAIIHQRAVPVLPGDTFETLEERVKVEAEHIVYPEALRMICSGEVTLSKDNVIIRTNRK